MGLLILKVHLDRLTVVVKASDEISCFLNDLVLKERMLSVHLVHIFSLHLSHLI